MPDTDPKSDWKVRGMPQSVRLWYHGQAAARGLTLAQWLAELKRLWVDEEPDYHDPVIAVELDDGIYYWKDGKYEKMPQEAVDLYRERQAIRDGKPAE